MCIDNSKSCLKCVSLEIILKQDEFYCEPHRISFGIFEVEK